MNTTARTMILRPLIAFALALATACLAHGQVLCDTLAWNDSLRHRAVPVAFYHLDGSTKDLPVVLFSHGYNENRPGAYKGYSHLAEAMARAGWFVVSVQHELPTDELLPLTGAPQVVRRPSWERGVANLLFVLDQLRRTHPALDMRRIAVMGHSQGGDISMLFAQLHPELVERVLSLDNRRMPLPRTRIPQVCSIRSSDQPADDGVLPTPREAQDHGMRIVPCSVPHNAMNDDATPEQHRELTGLVLEMLRDTAPVKAPR